MGRRSRSRSRGGGGGLSRRALLGGGAVAVGGAALVARSGASSQSTVTRGTSVDATGDDEALVGIAVAPSVVAGGDDQELVTITNNASRELSVTVTLSDPDDGEVHDPAATLGPDGEHAFSVSVVQGIETGEGALPFGIEATGDGSFHATIERRADVEEGDEPTLKRNIIDETKDTNAAFTIEYEVESVSDFDRLELDVENTSVGWIDGESFVRHSRDGVISYPLQGTDGGAEGHTYVSEWISHGTIPMWIGDHHVSLDTLEDVVDVAIDTNERVVHDRDRELFAVVNDDVVYYYSERGFWEETAWPDIDLNGGERPPMPDETGGEPASEPPDADDGPSLEDGSPSDGDPVPDPDGGGDPLPEPDDDDAWEQL